jgi:hypothetical protein
MSTPFIAMLETNKIDGYHVSIELDGADRNGWKYSAWIFNEDDRYFFIGECTFKRKPKRAQLEKFAIERISHIREVLKMLADWVPAAKVKEENELS